MGEWDDGPPCDLGGECATPYQCLRLGACVLMEEEPMTDTPALSPAVEAAIQHAYEAAESVGEGGWRETEHGWINDTLEQRLRAIATIAAEEAREAALEEAVDVVLDEHHEFDSLDELLATARDKRITREDREARATARQHTDAPAFGAMSKCAAP